MMGDYYRVICTLMSERRYSEALTVLQDAPMEKVGSFIYKVTPMLMEVEPEKTTNMLLNKNNLSINALLPTILHYTSSLDTREETEGDENFAIKFFEELLLRASINLEPFQEGDDALARNGVDVSVWMNSSIEPVAIQMIVWLLAKYDLLEDKLVSLLRKLYELQNSNLLSEVVSVDADFIMRQCRTHKRMKSSIYALLLLKNPIQAVSEALKVDITIAKSIASKYSDMTIRRSLWLEIAQYVVETESDMKKAVTLVHESKNTLQIEVSRRNAM